MTKSSGASPSRTMARPDLSFIASLVAPRTRVLDIGCGDGSLLEELQRTKGVDGRGLELSEEGVHKCVARGLAVVEGDANTDLVDYPAKAFDYVVLSMTIQAMAQPREVLGHMLRIGRRGIVSFPNFGHWRVRLSFATQGCMPVTAMLGHTWYGTPNIHLCTIRDFVDLIGEMGHHIEGAWLIDAGRIKPFSATSRTANLFGEQAIFLLESNGSG